MTRSATPPADAPQAALDAGLRCRVCGYNLTGLTHRRCPECGTAFDPADPRVQATPPPQIAFERYTGVGRLYGWLRTWITVLTTPWIFARQVTIRGSVTWSVAFLLGCLVWSPIALLIDADWDLILIWWCTIAVNLPPQVLLLTLLDFPHWRRPLRSLRFWWIVSGYTSAVVVLETFFGPALIPLQTLIDAALQVTRGQPLDVFPFGEIFAPTWSALATWGQVVLWLAALTCCFACRLRPRGWHWTWAGPYLVLYPVILLLAYAASVEYIGIRLFAGMFF